MDSKRASSRSACRALVSLGLLIAVTVASQACYSGLLLIPTIDVVPKGTISVEYQTDGVLRTRQSDTHFINTQYGLTDQVELGLDYDVSADAEQRFFGNAKYVVPMKKDSAFKFAVGFSGLTEHKECSPYGVASFSHGKLRTHAGAIRIDGKVRSFAGLDYAATDKLTLMADWTDGIDNYSSVGASWCLAKNASVLAGVAFPNAGGDARFSVHFVVTLP